MIHTLPSIIIVEDDLMQAEVMQDLLETPTRVATVVGKFTSSRLFLSWYETSPSHPAIDLILLDMRLPGELGYDLLPKIRQQPGLEKVRVLAVTANVLPLDVERARQAGFDGFIGKPIDPFKFPLYIQYAIAGTKIWKPL